MTEKHWRSYLKRVFVLLMAVSTIGFSQLITLKTVPVAAGNQFANSPSHSRGMGGVSIAVEDGELDPFINPAKGQFIEKSKLFLSPALYNISNQNGASRSLPFTALVQSRKWFGGISLTAQQAEKPPFFNDIWFGGDIFVANSVDILSEQHDENYYYSGYFGWRFPEKKMALAFGVAGSDLSAMDGVSHLYANSLDLEQFGYTRDYRLGLSGSWSEGREYEALLLFNEVRMTHDVTYPGWFIAENFSQNIGTVRNLDRTSAWGAHFGYKQPLGQKGAKLGSTFTINRSSHPKIPNYDLMRIPRDPGTTWAFSSGLGISHTNGSETVAAELLFEPIWSNTWADAGEPTETVSGKIIPTGGKTVENDFQFTNWIFRTGVSHQGERFGIQIGLQTRLFQYWLDQTHFVEEFERSQREGWLEWTPTAGFSLTFPGFQLRYTGQITLGAGEPGIVPGGFGIVQDEALASSSRFIVAPAGTLTLQESTVYSHQFTLAVPLD